MASLTRSQLKTSSNSTYDTNGVGGITAAEVRTFNDDLIDSLITNDITGGMSVATASLALTASSVANGVLTPLNQFTASATIRLNNLETTSASVNISIANLNGATGSYAISASVAAVDTAQQQQINSLIAASSSYANSASFAASQLVQDGRLNNLETTSASLLIETSNLELFSASALISINALNTNSASVNTSITNINSATQSLQAQLTTIGGQSGSWVTESETGSFAITGSNNFVGNQRISGDLFVTSSNQIGFIRTGGLISNASIKIGDDSGNDITLTSNDVNVNLNGGDVKIYNSSAGNGIQMEGADPLIGLRDTSAPNNPFIGLTNKNNRLEIIDSTSTIVTMNTASFNIPSASFTASLQQGYAWVGDSTGKTVTVATSSFGGTTDLTSLNSFTASANQRIGSLEAATSSYVTETESGSFLLTASFDNGTRNLTFTKGNNTTFGVNIPDISGSTGNFVTTSSFNAYTQSNDQRVSSLETNSASVNTSITNINSTTASLNTSITNLNTFSASALVSISNLNASSASQQISIDNLNTNSASVNTSITNINSATASLFTSASLTLVTASFDNGTRNLTFTKGNTTQFSVNIPDVSGSTFDTGSLVTTASFNSYTSSNDQKVNSLISATGSYVTSAITASSLVTASVNLNTITFTKGDGTTFPITVNTGSGGGGTIDTGSFATTGSNTFIGTQTSPAQILKDKSNNQFTILPASSSMMLVANGFTTASAHLSASNDFSMNLIFKGNNHTGDTIISGSSNIFTNAVTPTTGYTRYIGGSNNLYLNSTNGINSQVTQSAASVSGNRPTMNNNIFNGETDFLINQAVNTGTHTYSHNKIGGTNATVTINALSHTGSVNIQANTVNNGVITINASSASLAEIATGRSGSGTVSITSNLIQGGAVTNTSPIALGTSLTQTILSNIVTGGSITITNISSSVAVNASNNIAIGAMSYTNAGAAGLALHRTQGSIGTSYGAMTFVASGSAIAATANISPTAMTVTNRMYSGSLGSGSLTFANNQIQGGGNTYTVTGSWGTTGTGASMAANGIFGITNTIFTNVEGRGGYADFRSNLVGGANLILTGSNNNTVLTSGGGYFGRYNANDGVRNGTGETVFLVGTGTSTARKTGFLIDSGSNSYFEGTLNVSGSTILSGSLYIQSGSTLPSATGSSILTWNPTTGQVSQSPIATLISSSFSVGAFNSTITQSGSAAVSQSMTFNNTDISNGVSIVSNSQITLANTGTYNIQFSAQLLASTGADTIWIWLKKNGTNVSNTATKLVLKNNEASVAAWNFVVPATASDYFELVWQSLDGHATLLTEAAAGNYPAIPSIIVTVTQVE